LGEDYYEQKHRERILKALEKQARRLGYQLTLVNPEKAGYPEPEEDVITEPHAPEDTGERASPRRQPCAHPLPETATSGVPAWLFLGRHAAKRSA